MIDEKVESRRGMLVVKVEDKEVGIKFRHLFTAAMVRGVMSKVKITHCALFELFEGDKTLPKMIHSGIAKCSARDAFNKEKGRKVSLTRALLEGVHFFSGNRERREAVWNAYLNRPRVQSTPKDGAPSTDQPVIEGQVVNVQKLLDSVDLTKVH